MIPFRFWCFVFLILPHQICKGSDCNENPALTLVFSKEGIDTEISRSNSSEIFTTPTNNRFIVQFTCEAPFPIQMILQPRDTRLQISQQSTYRRYSDFKNDSSYTFGLQFTINFQNLERNLVFSCSAISDRFCSEHALFTYLSNSHEVNLTVTAASNNKESAISSVDNETAAFSPVPTPSKFYYKETQSDLFPSYSFQCEFQAVGGGAGHVRQLPCLQSVIFCRELFGGIANNEETFWKLEKEDENENLNCTDCPVMTPKSFEPFFIGCSQKQKDDDGGRGRGANDDEDSISWGRLVRFGTPQGYQRRPLIYLSNDNDEEQMLHMKYFHPLQVVNDILQVKCSASAYLTQNTFQFALEHTKVTELEFLPVSDQVFYTANTHSVNQILSINLTSLSIRRIFCFVGLQTSRRWLNTSRLIQVVDWEDYLKPRSCPPPSTVHLAQLPSVGISSRPDKELTKKRRNWFFQGSRKNNEIFCRAPYPVQFRFKPDFNKNFNNKDKGAIISWIKPRRETDNFWEPLTYNYKVFFELQFTPEIAPGGFRCEAVNDPCSHKTIMYNFLPQSNQLKLSLLDSQKGQQTLPLIENDGMQEKNDECETIFYYEEQLRGFPYYAFYCQFPFGRPGKISLINCFRQDDCQTFYRDKKLPNSCWKRKEVGDCPNCEKLQFNHAQPAFLTCSAGSESSVSKAFVFFGVAPNANSHPAIYFSDENIKPSDMIEMSPFEPFQAYGTRLHFTCSISGFYLQTQIILGLKLAGESRLQISKSNWPVFDTPRWSRTHTLTIPLNNMKLERIYCLSGPMNTIDWVNKSQPIVVRERKALQVAVSLRESREGERESQLLEEVGSGDFGKQVELTFDLGSQNQTIYCQAFGFPIPQITWSANRNLEHQVTTQLVEDENGSHSRVSRLEFKKIRSGDAGEYRCEAENGQENIEASVILSVEKPTVKGGVNLTLIIVGSMLGFLFVLGVYLAYHWRRMKRLMGNLTDDQVDDFFHGNTQCGENDPHAAVYGLPYNQSYEIPRSHLKIDETSVLGSGQFGVVLRGLIIRSSGDELVAVKTVKSNVDTENFLALLSEIKILGHVGKHENVASLVASCTDSIKHKKVFAAVEFCGKGDLKKFLMKNRDNFISKVYQNEKADFQMEDLLRISLGIAQGMAFLEEKRVIHGDLAARNVLSYCLCPYSRY